MKIVSLTRRWSPLAPSSTLLCAALLCTSSAVLAAPRSEMVTEGHRASCAQRQALDRIAPQNRPLVVAARARSKLPANSNMVASTAPCLAQGAS